MKAGEASSREEDKINMVTWKRERANTLPKER